VTVCGYPLGGVKVSSGTAKNHYPKGLRRMG
jgi:NOL1/NOP2/fmu family ribosome biogenesis protein